MKEHAVLIQPPMEKEAVGGPDIKVARRRCSKNRP
jgi:hypothetical protein